MRQLSFHINLYLECYHFVYELVQKVNLLFSEANIFLLIVNNRFSDTAETELSEIEISMIWRILTNR